MSGPNPIPAGPKIEADWRSNKPASIPRLPPSWTATVLLTPFIVDDANRLPEGSQPRQGHELVNERVNRSDKMGIFQQGVACLAKTVRDFVPSNVRVR